MSMSAAVLQFPLKVTQNKSHKIVPSSVQMYEFLFQTQHQFDTQFYLFCYN